MLRISRQKSSRKATTLLLEGTLAGPWVTELRDVCERILAEQRRLELDLAGVAFVDGEGARLLASLYADNRIQLSETSLFVDEILGRTRS